MMKQCKTTATLEKDCYPREILMIEQSGLQQRLGSNFLGRASSSGWRGT